jgi:hypothetical protein
LTVQALVPVGDMANLIFLKHNYYQNDFYLKLLEYYIFEFGRQREERNAEKRSQMKIFCAVTFKMSQIAKGLQYTCIIETLNGMLVEKQGEYYSRLYLKLKELPSNEYL